MKAGLRVVIASGGGIFFPSGRFLLFTPGKILPAGLQYEVRFVFDGEAGRIEGGFGSFGSEGEAKAVCDSLIDQYAEACAL